MTDQIPIRAREPAGQPAPDRAGIGLRAPHHRSLLETRPPVGWLEIHAENYMGGGAARRCLEQAAALWPVSVHGVGLGLGGSEPPDPAHLDRLARLTGWLQPALVSEHLAWTGVDGRYYNDLLPLPYTADSLAQVCRNVEIVQDRLQRPILIENPATYLRFRESQIAEADFLARLAAHTGCGILCDVNNVYVSSVNHVGLEAAPAVAAAYLDSLPAGLVREIHLAGHAENDADGRLILIDDHGGLVAEPVWQLYAVAVRRFPAAVTLLEWDSNVPPLDHLVAEAAQADRRRAAALAGHDAPPGPDGSPDKTPDKTNERAA
ncbi:DUF692 domain-containing protein [Ferrovibrio sp.]|uniref:MNIO family bufferin maturase n=1 Tax=Ferrovibrio sp. TaxID=1917215 RepID=UPI003518BF6E